MHHREHPEIVRRLKRTEGHLRKVIGMLEERRDCLAIAQQLLAVEKAVTNAKRTLLKDHIDHCLEHALVDGPKEARKTVVEFREITRYL